MVDLYYSSLLASYGLVVMLFVQSLIAIRAHRKQSEYVPGVVAQNLSHESFVFRSNRTFLNSLENMPMMLFSIALAMVFGVDAFVLAVLTWTFLVARFVHMVLYYAIATEKNPSPRSYFFIIGFFCQLVLLVLIGIAIFS